MSFYGPLIDSNFGPTLNFFMALLVENYSNTLFLSYNVVFFIHKG